MCLIAIAHRASARFPLVIAANRDEDYERPTRSADFWEEAPDVLGGRDLLHGGSWLAVTRDGRFAAVTNLRGALPAARSRGLLVRDFVTSQVAPLDYAGVVAAEAQEFAGFHLLAGETGGTLAWSDGSAQKEILPGILGVSNAPAGERWPKTESAEEELHRALALPDAQAVAARLLAMLTTPRGSGAVESEIFIAGSRYGTRASTVIVLDGNALLFVEQSHLRDGASAARREFSLTL